MLAGASKNDWRNHREPEPADRTTEIKRVRIEQIGALGVFGRVGLGRYGLWGAFCGPVVANQSQGQPDPLAPTLPPSF